MRIEIDFGSSSGNLRRAVLVTLPVVAIAACLWFFGGPILETCSPFALAFVLAYLLSPVVDWIAGERRGRLRIHRALAILLLYLGVGLSIPMVLAAILPRIFAEGAEFGRKVSRDYLPALGAELRPRLEYWFSAKSLLENGDFTEWNEGLPIDWEASEDARCFPLDEDPPSGLRVSPAVEEQAWVLSQNLAELPSDSTFTLAVVVREATSEVHGWTVALTSDQSAATSFAWRSPIPPAGGLRESVYIPAEVERALFSLEAEPGAGEIRLESVALLQPPPLPFFQPGYWTGVYEEYRHLLTWSNLSTVFTYGAKGAGMVAGGAGGAWAWLSARVGGLVSLAVYVALLCVILFYMLLDFTAFKQGCLEVIPEKWRPRAVGFASELDRQLGGFIRGQAMVCLSVGLMVTFFLLILRVPFAIPIGIAAGCFNFIPYLGPAMGMIPAVTLTLLEFFDPETTANWVLVKLLLVLGSFMVVQAADGLLISPKVMAKTVDVSPLVVMAALMLGGGIAGVTGMVLAIPMYCLLRVLVGEYRREIRDEAGSAGPES
ncbi:MAG: hypothetical protein GHCLOJNM_02503 [bacterium]|nr:hypothetical protein [bacterium]